jgi:Eukaryotic aspartyl protease
VPLNVSKDAVLDSGTSLTYIPNGEYDQIIALVIRGKTCQMSSTGGYYICPCSSVNDQSFPTLTLYFTDVNGASLPFIVNPS